MQNEELAAQRQDQYYLHELPCPGLASVCMTNVTCKQTTWRHSWQEIESLRGDKAGIEAGGAIAWTEFHTFHSLGFFPVIVYHFARSTTRGSCKSSRRPWSETFNVCRTLSPENEVQQCLSVEEDRKSKRTLDHHAFQHL